LQEVQRGFFHYLLGGCLPVSGPGAGVSDLPVGVFAGAGGGFCAAGGATLAGGAPPAGGSPAGRGAGSLLHVSIIAL